MRHPTRKHDYFDHHRKDHAGRPFLFTAVVIGSALVWVALFAVILRVV